MKGFVVVRFPREYRYLVFAALLLASLSASSDVYVKPHFGHPYIFHDRIVFTSVDGTHLIAIDKRGNLMWEIECPERILEQKADEDRFFVQCGRKVWQIDAEGKRSDLFTMPEFETLIVGDEDFLAAGDLRFDRKRLRIINPLDYKTAWESSTIESIVRVTPSTIVAVTADRKYGRRDSYHLENGALAGFERSTGRVRWSIPLSRPIGEIRSAVVGSFLAALDSEWESAKLLILNPDTGDLLSQSTGRFVDLWPLDDSLAVLEDTQNGSEADLFVCKLPQCTRGTPVRLQAKEMLRVRLYRDYIITAGIYDSACFERSTGKRLWEKGQLEWSEPFDDEMVITDFSPKNQKARIVSIDLSTGHESVLFTRTVTEHDRKNFRPW